MADAWRHEPLQQQHIPRSHVTIRLLWNGHFSGWTILSNISYGWPGVPLCCFAKLQSSLAVLLADIPDESNFAKLLTHVTEPVPLLAHITRGCWPKRFPDIAGLQSCIAQPGYSHDTELFSGFPHLVANVA
jgi:hypothetical protein